MIPQQQHMIQQQQPTGQPSPTIPLFTEFLGPEGQEAQQWEQAQAKHWAQIQETSDLYYNTLPELFNRSGGAFENMTFEELDAL